MIWFSPNPRRSTPVYWRNAVRGRGPVAPGGIAARRARQRGFRFSVARRPVRANLESEIIVRQDGTAKVVDFGLARMAESGPELLLEKTKSGSVMGTPRYMSPEQARGETIPGVARTPSTNTWIFRPTS